MASSQNTLTLSKLQELAVFLSHTYGTTDPLFTAALDRLREETLASISQQVTSQLQQAAQAPTAPADTPAPRATAPVRQTSTGTQATPQAPSPPPTQPAAAPQPLSTTIRLKVDRTEAAVVTQKENPVQFRFHGGTGTDPRRFKTQLCKHWLAQRCTYGDRCCYAHGAEQLRKEEDNVAELVNLAMKGSTKKKSPTVTFSLPPPSPPASGSTRSSSPSSTSSYGPSSGEDERAPEPPRMKSISTATANPLNLEHDDAWTACVGALLAQQK